MQVRIIEKHFGGIEFGPEMRVLHLGGQSSANVERLEFSLPEQWAGCAVTLHIQRQDSTLPSPILLDENAGCAVGKEFTASPCGQWMLLALGEDGYRALTRPARYDCYETLNTEGDAEISPTQYETFVAQVLSYANNAASSAKEARNAAAAAKQGATDAQAAENNTAAAAERALAAQKSAGTDTNRAEAAAKRAEELAPEDGTVLSVNGKGGVVTLGDGSTLQYQTQDTTTLENMNGVLRVENGGTGQNTALTAQDVGAVESGSRNYLKSAEVNGGTLVLTYGNGEQKSFTVDLGGYYTKEEVDRLIEEQKLKDHPVGSLFHTIGPTSPANLFGGTWEEIAQDRTLMGASSAHAAGTTAEAGLPDIAGTFQTMSLDNTSASGAFAYKSKSRASYTGEGSTTVWKGQLSLNASSSSAVYGKSDTVQPAAYYVHIWLRTA